MILCKKIRQKDNSESIEVRIHCLVEAIATKNEGKYRWNVPEKTTSTTGNI